MKKIYSILTLALIAFATIWAVESSSEEAVKVWNFSEWEQATYEETTTIDGLTIVTVSGKKVVIDGNKKTIDGVEYTQRLKFGGKTDWTGNDPKDRALTFDVTGPTTVKIAFCSAATDGTGRFLNVYAGDKTNPLTENGFEAPTTAPEVVEFEYTGEEATTLIVAVDGGINLYFISATAKVAEEEGDQPGTGNDEQDPMQNDQKVAVDVLTAEALGVDPTGKSYADYTATLASGASYSANCMQNSNGSIQLRSNNNNSGIVTTVSGGKAAYVAVNWDAAATNAARTIQVYGKNEPYAAPTDLYNDETAGTLIGVIGVNLEDNPNNDLAITDEYEYIGIRSGYGALYAESIEITWLQAAPVMIDNFVALSDIEEGTEVMIGKDVTVVVANEAANLLWDGTSYYGAKFDNAVEAGDIIAAGWTATATALGLQAEEEVTVAGKAEVLPEPIVVTAEDVMSTYYVWNYVTLEGVYLPEGIDEFTTAEFVAGVQETYVYNLLGIDAVEAGTYDLTGFWMEMPAINVMEGDEDYLLDDMGVDGGEGEDNMGLDTPTIVFVPTKAEVSVTKIDNFVALADFEEGTEVIVNMDVTVVVANEAANLLWDGTSYYGAKLENAVAEGDIIAAGWKATATSLGLQAEEEVAVAGKAEVLPEPIAVTSEDVMSTYYVWNYVTLEGVYLPEGIDEFTTAEFVAGDQETYVYNLLGIDAVEAGTYDLTGFWMEMPAINVMEGDEDYLLDDMGVDGGEGEDNMGLDTPTIVFVPTKAEVSVTKIDNFVALADFEEGTEVIINMDVTVVVANEAANLLWDGTSYYGAKLENAVAEGDIIAAGWKATATALGLQAEEEVAVAGKAEVLPEPIVVTAEDVMSTYYVWNYVTLEGVYLPEGIDEFTTAEFVAGVQETYVYNLLGIDAVEAGTYDLTGFWMEMPAINVMEGDEDYLLDDMGVDGGEGEDNMGVDTPTIVFVPTKAEVSPVKIDNFVALVDVPENTVVVVDCPATVVVASEVINLIWDGTSFYGAQFNNEVAKGDVIAAGWSAVLTSMGLMATANVEISGDAETMPLPVEVDAESLRSSIVNYGYQTLLGAYVDEAIEEGGNGVAYVGDEEVNIWDILGIGVEAGEYNITGFWFDASAMMAGMFGDEDYLLDDMGVDAPVWFFVPVSVESTLPTIEDFVALADVPELTPFIVGMETTVAEYVDGCALLYDGTSYFLAMFDQDLNQGDVIAAGWMAFTYTGMLAALDEEVPVSGAGVAPTPTTVDNDNFNESIVNYNYVKIVGVEIPEGLASDDADYLTTDWGETFIGMDLFSTFGSVEGGKTYDVTGFWMDIAPLMAEVANTDGEDELLDDMGVDSAMYVFVPLTYGDNTSSILGIESANGDVHYFNINGMRVAQPKAGDVIIKIANGKASKVLVK